MTKSTLYQANHLLMITRPLQRLISSWLTKWKKSTKSMEIARVARYKERLRSSITKFIRKESAERMHLIGKTIMLLEILLNLIRKWLGLVTFYSIFQAINYPNKNWMSSKACTISIRRFWICKSETLLKAHPSSNKYLSILHFLETQPRVRNDSNPPIQNKDRLEGATYVDSIIKTNLCLNHDKMCWNFDWSLRLVQAFKRETLLPGKWLGHEWWGAFGDIEGNWADGKFEGVG